MSDIIRVSKVFTFDMGHALFGYDGPVKIFTDILTD